MKKQIKQLLIALVLLSALNSTAHAQGTAFTYEGQLQNNGSPASGNYNLMFTPYTVTSGGSPLVASVTTNGVIVTNGLFTVTIDFGGGVFAGQVIWLEVGVESNGISSFTTLAPRQQLTPTPYAIYAESVNAAGLSGTIPAVNFGGSYGNAVTLNNPGNNFTGNGAGLTGLNAAQLTSIGNNNGGSYNFFVGSSGNAITTGSFNTANGYEGLFNDTTGFGNTADGADALYYNTIGSGNTAIGNGALLYNTSGSNNIALGSTAGNYITTGSYNIDIGNQGISTDTNIIRIGSGQSQTYIAGVLNGNGGGLTGLDASQLKSIGNGSGDLGNFFVGPAGNATTSGDANTALGGSAFSANTSGYENTAIGVDALFANTTGSDNTAMGRSALDDNTTGIDNTAIGVTALVLNKSGSYNTANGFKALSFNTTGSNNIALGYQAGYNISTGSSNIDIGNLGIANDANTIRIGGGQGQTYLAGIYGATPNQGSATAVYVDANGQLGTVGPGGGGSGSLPSYAVTNGETSPVALSNDLFVTALSLPSTAITPDIIYSGSALLLYGDNNGNFFSGQNAGNVTTTGSANTADGVFALTQNTLGANNAAYGFDALFFNTSGSNNLALGYQAGYNITTGSSNIDIGNPGVTTDTNTIRIGSGQSQTYIAGVLNGNGGGLTNLSAAQLTSIGNADSPFGGNFFAGPATGNLTVSGYDNLGFGHFALLSLTSGYDNTAIGNGALEGNMSGVGNTALGTYTLPNITGSYNTAVGEEALYSNTNGNNNTAVGYYALKLNSSGSNNVASGYEALFSSTTGSNNVADGCESLYFTRTGSGNIALGYEAGYSLGLASSSNIDIGNPGVNNENNTIRIGTTQTQTYLAGVINGNGGGLTNLNAAQLTGALTPAQLPSGVVTNNESGVALNGTFSGDGSGLVNINISASLLNGNFTGSFSGDGSKLTGLNASQLTSIGNSNPNNYNFFIGQSGNSTTSGGVNLAGGYDALSFNTSGSFNIAFGGYALTLNQSGSFNTAVGDQALYSNTNGSQNTAVGASALFLNQSGENNTAFGDQALYNLGGQPPYAGGSNNIALGYQAGHNFSGNESSNIDIGNPGVAGESGIIRIGDPNVHTATYLAGTVYANGVALASDRNAKENFTTLNAKEVLAKVISLPVSEWNYKNNPADTRHIGPMAQDFHAAFQLDGADDKHISVVDEGGVALAAIQGLNQKLEGEVKERDVEIQNLEKKLDELQSVVKQLAANK